MGTLDCAADLSEKNYDYLICFASSVIKLGNNY